MVGGGGEFTVTVIGTLLEIEPLVPVTVTKYAPESSAESAVIERLELLV